MKFTEEQYQKIVNTYELQNDYVEAIRLVLDYIDELNWLGYKEAMVIANPLNREWARDKFVQKDKKSHFVLKDVSDDDGNLYHLIDSNGVIQLNPWLNSGYHPKIKESDVRKWGYNPEMFDREEA